MGVDFDALVLAGGAGRRMGGVLKPVIPVAGVRMIDRVLAALAGASRIVVVGPDELSVDETAVGRGSGRRSQRLTDAAPVPEVAPPTDAAPAPLPVPELVCLQEDPPGGGPVAAIGAGIHDGAFGAGIIVLVAGDLPLLTQADVGLLVNAVTRLAHEDQVGAIFTDENRRPQWLCSAWRAGPLRDRLRVIAAERGGALAGAAMRDVFGALAAVEVGAPDVRGRNASGDDLPPWFDCDTESDVRRAGEWLIGHADQGS